MNVYLLIIRDLENHEVTIPFTSRAKAESAKGLIDDYGVVTRVCVIQVELVEA
jgi:hypothetical protein